MAKIVLTITADNKATQSVKLLNAEVQTLSKTLSSIKVNKNLTTQINALTKHYTAIAQAHAKITANANKQAIADEKLRQQQTRSQTEAVKLATAQARLEKAQQKTTTSTVQLQKKLATLLSTIKSLKNSYPQGTFDSIEQSVRANLQAAKDGTKSVEDLGTAYNDLSRDLAVAKAETEKVTTAVVKSGDSIGSLAKKFLLWQVTATLVMKPLRLISDALNSINETLVKTEDAIIALQRVLPIGSASDSEISSRLYKIAQDYGQTFENVSQIAQNFARTGMSWVDTIKATEAAVLALNVAELNATQASDGMIAILTQFGLKAEDLMLVVDKLNITADNAAVTTEKLLAALQRTGSAAANANLNLDETVSLITALSQATGRSGENIGTALNSLIQYSSKASALDTFAGLSNNTANVVAEYRKGAKTILDVWKAVAQEIQSLDTKQADLLDSYFATEDGNALKEALDGELEDIYTELGGVYDTANTFRKNYFIALLGNMDTVEQAMKTLQGAQGYSQEENQKYLDTYTAKLNKLKAQWEEFANSQQGLLWLKKFIVDVGSAVLWLVKHTGGLKTTLLAISTTVLALKGAKIIERIRSTATAIKGLATSLRTATTVAKGLPAALSLIGTAATAISIFVGAYKSFAEENRQKNKEIRQEAIAGYKNAEEQYKELKNLISQYKEIRNSTDQATESNKNLEDIEKKLIESLGEKADALSTLTKGTNEYREAVENLTESEIVAKKQDVTVALEAAKQELAEFNVGGFSSHWYGDKLGESNLSSTENKILKSIGVSTDSWNKGKRHKLSGLKDDNTIESTLANYEIFKNARDKLWEEYTKALRAGDDVYAEQVKSLYTRYYYVVKEVEPYIENYKKIKSSLEDIDKKSEDITVSEKEWANNITEVKGKYDDLISKLEELRDLQKESTEWEEKKLAVLEAEQALENAKNEATVRRFNQATGQWEWQTDEKKIAEAEKNLEQAQLNLQEAAYNNIIDQLEKETATNDSILAILKEVAPLLGEDFSNAVQNAIKDKTGVDITQPIVTPSESHDNGGLALGKGFINKATDRPESVNNPELTKKILSPVSNAEFNRYVRDMGIMFERSHQYAQTPIMERVGGAVDNRVNNSGQVFIQGVNVGAEKRDGILDALALAPLMSDN